MSDEAARATRDSARAEGEHKLYTAMAMVMMLLLCLSIAFAPADWVGECVIGSVVVPGLICWIVDRYPQWFG